MKKLKKERIHWVCSDCGEKYGKHKAGLSTWHEDICDMCGKRVGVTELRDFGYLKDTIYRAEYSGDYLN